MKSPTVKVKQIPGFLRVNSLMQILQRHSRGSCIKIVKCSQVEETSQGTWAVIVLNNMTCLVLVLLVFQMQCYTIKYGWCENMSLRDDKIKAKSQRMH